MKKDDYCRLGSADDMISAGLHLTDLNLFDSTSELLVTNMGRSKEVEDAFERVSLVSSMTNNRFCS